MLCRLAFFHTLANPVLRFFFFIFELSHCHDTACSCLSRPLAFFVLVLLGRHFLIACHPRRLFSVRGRSFPHTAPFFALKTLTQVFIPHTFFFLFYLSSYARTKWTLFPFLAFFLFPFCVEVFMFCLPPPLPQGSITITLCPRA